MRTTITISDSYIKDLLHYTHTKKTIEAVNIVIHEWLRLRKIAEIKTLQGNLSIDDNLSALRAKELKKLEKFHE